MDANEFRRASRAVWDAMAPAWDAGYAFFEQSARPVTERMLALLEPAEGQTILDLAAGTGVAGLAAAPIVGARGRVILGDFSEAMVHGAEHQVAELGLDNVECRVLDAERLELPDEAVDGVLCRWGYMLMGDPGAALAETHRVLRPHGRLAFAVFAGPEQNPWAELPIRVLAERGHMPPATDESPGIFGLAGRDRLDRLTASPGFDAVRIEDVGFTWRFADADRYWEFLTDAAGAIAMVIARLDDEERARVRQDVGERVAAHRSSGGIELPAVSLVVTAARP